MKKSAALTKPVPREKPAPRHDKYFLRDLHQEIDFYDRKLAYLDKFTEFASPGDRQAAEKGLRAKRAPLEKAALELVASGVEYEEKDLPRSFRTMNLDHDGAQKSLTLVKRFKQPAAAQTAADR
ncbi:MAG TPA: hypothetical protein VME86_11715 [Acidobacteriaceae bacterium]|nr:hypothetical protein [Acidobacteriaceae bacterium]